MYYESYDIGTTASTILYTPPNYSFQIKDMYVGNSSTVANNDIANIQALLTTSGAVSGTLNLAQLPQTQGTNAYNRDDPLIVPAGSYLIATSVYGNIKLTIGGTYVFYRE